jgi:DNA-binding CsgD family transcriptional regulator
MPIEKRVPEPVLLAPEHVAAAIRLVHGISPFLGDPQLYLAAAMTGLQRLLGANGALLRMLAAKPDPHQLLDLFSERWNSNDCFKLNNFVRSRSNSVDGLETRACNGSDIPHADRWHYLSSFRRHGQHVCVIAVKRGRSFSQQEQCLLHAVHQSVVFDCVADQTAERIKKPLSARKVQVLESLIAGQSEKEIASHLSISFHTVHVHVKDLYQRFQVHSRAELINHSLRVRHSSTPSAS